MRVPMRCVSIAYSCVELADWISGRMGGRGDGSEDDSRGAQVGLLHPPDHFLTRGNSFCKTCASDYRMRHLKRVARRLKPDGSGGVPVVFA